MPQTFSLSYQFLQLEHSCHDDIRVAGHGTRGTTHVDDTQPRSDSNLRNKVIRIQDTRGECPHPGAINWYDESGFCQNVFKAQGKARACILSFSTIITRISHVHLTDREVEASANDNYAGERDAQSGGHSASLLASARHVPRATRPCSS